MANGNGYIKLHRKFLEWQWYSDGNTKSVFIHCLLSANYQETKWKNEVIPIGAFITSAEKLGAEIGLSRQQIRRAFFNLQTTNEITIKSTNKYTIVYVQNWAKYQIDAVDGNQQKNKQKTPNSTNKQPTNNQQTTTDKEIKKERIEEIKKSTKGDMGADAPFYHPTLEEVRAYCKERNNNVDPETWFHHYDGNGWKVGKNPMKKWKSAIITWERNGGTNGTARGSKPDAKIDWLPDYMKSIEGGNRA